MANTCDGCGRPLGIRAWFQCPCWRSHSREALIPDRLFAKTRRVEAMYRKAAKQHA